MSEHVQPPEVTAWPYREFLAAVKDGQAWIGTTARGRSMVDRVPDLAEIVEWAIIGRETANRELTNIVAKER